MLGTITLDSLDDIQAVMPKASTVITILALSFVAFFAWLLIKGRRDRVLQFFMETFQDETSNKARGVLLSAFGASMLYFFLLLRGSLFGTFPPQYVLDNLQSTMFSLFGITGLLAGAKAFAERTTQVKTEVMPGPPTRVQQTTTTAPPAHIEDENDGFTPVG